MAQLPTQQERDFEKANLMKRTAALKANLVKEYGDRIGEALYDYLYGKGNDLAKNRKKFAEVIVSIFLDDTADIGKKTNVVLAMLYSIDVRLMEIKEESKRAYNPNNIY